uniref:Uncharacterized protein n=1 Tax=Anguilla anguilla TaxID=7936 RepID=A0A0E9VZ35_ANGAN
MFIFLNLNFTLVSRLVESSEKDLPLINTQTMW